MGIFRINNPKTRFEECMKTRFLTLSIAAVVGALALSTTPAEAGGCKKRHKHGHHSYNRGEGDYGYYGYRPVRYFQPIRYAPYYYDAPGFQIGFAFGGNGRCR
jgi:hypothetical protein